MYYLQVKMMNTTDQMNQGAVFASRGIDTITSVPGRIFRAPGKLIQNIKSNAHHFAKDFRTLREEVRREKAEGKLRIAEAKRQLREIKAETAAMVKEVKAEGAENIRVTKGIVSRVRESVNKRVALATERMAGQKAIARMKREEEKAQSRIDALEQRIVDLDRALHAAHAAAYGAPIQEEGFVDDPIAKARKDLEAVQAAAAKAEAETRKQTEAILNVVTAKAEEPSPEAAIEEPAEPSPDGFQNLLKEKGEEMVRPQIRQEEEALVPGAGIPPTDDGDDEKL